MGSEGGPSHSISETLLLFTWESGAEVFYRLRLTQAVGLMPDIQYWSRDERDGESAGAWVFGLRMEFGF